MPPPLRAAAALGIRYRALGEADAELNARLYASTRVQEVAAFGWPAEMQRQFLAQQHDAQDRHFQRYHADIERLIIERGGEPIGRLYLEETSSSIHVVDILLLPECTGTGIGTAILRDILEEAQAANKPVELEVLFDNPARRLYERLGFVHVSEEGIHHRLEWRPPQAEAMD
jgi:GNAT superfamily N-acetyltransferase